VCLWLCTASVHNTTQNSSDNLLSYLQTNIVAQVLSVGGERGNVRTTAESFNRTAMHILGTVVAFLRFWRPLQTSLRTYLWRHNSATNRRIATKFGRWMQNDITITTHRSKSKPEVQFQYGCLPSSAMPRDISSKFDMQIVIHLLKQVPSLNLKPEVDFWHHGRYLKNAIWRHNPAKDRLITTKFGRLNQITCGGLKIGQNLNR